MINGKTYSYYGFVPISHTGFLDIPGRVGEISYDWGDYIEPLVHADDLFWGSRDLTVKVVYDPRITSFSFADAVNILADIQGYFDIQNEYGSFEVKFREAKKDLHQRDGIAVWSLVFTEREPRFIESLPVAIGGNGLTIDGCDLSKELDILISVVKLQDDIASLNASTITRYHPYRPYTDFRTFKILEISCTMVRSDGYIGKLETLKKVLASPGFRIVRYNSTEYKCFLTNGFRVEVGKGVVRFVIKLNIFSQAGLFTEPLFGSGLFYYGNQRKFLQSLFEYNLFKTGIFQR